MLKWNEHLYLGKSVQTHEAEIRARLDRGAIDIGHYLITCAANPEDQLDILRTSTLLTKQQLAQLTEIVGIAGTKAEAYSLIIHMTEDCLRSQGNANLRDYFNSYEKI